MPNSKQKLILICKIVYQYIKHLWGYTLVNSKGKEFDASVWSGEIVIDAALACIADSNRFDVAKIILVGRDDRDGQTMTYWTRDL